MDTAPNALYLMLCIVLIASSLIGMRLSAGKAIKMLLAWVALFGLAFALFSFRGEFGALGARLKTEAVGDTQAVVSGSTLRLRKQGDGHFWVDARIDGRPVRFLVDSGATTTTVAQSIADAAGLEAGMRGDMVSTANGTVFMPKTRVNVFEVGTIRRTDLTVNINPNDDISVLGMNFLSSLTSWGVQGDTMVMTP